MSFTSPDPDNAFFANSIHEDLLTQLSKVAALRPGLPKAHIAMGFYYYHAQRNYEQALVAEFSR